MVANQRHLARSDVLWGIAFFFTIQIAIAVALDRSWSSVRDPEYGTKLRFLRELTQADSRPLILMLGSSRTLNGLRPDCLPRQAAMPRAFNFGLTSHGPLQQLLCLKRLRADGMRPDGLVLELAPMLLCERTRVPLERQKFTDLARLSDYEADWLSMYWHWFQSRAVPSFSYRYSLMSRYRPNWLTWEQRKDGFWTQTDRDGWYAHQIATAANHSLSLDSARQSYRPLLQSYLVNPLQDRALRETLAYAKGEKIPVAVLLMPEGPIFQSWYSEETRNRINGYLAELRETYSVPVIDGRSWIPDESFFADSHHLTPDGATRFTRRFADEVLPLFAGQR